ncbi:MAG: hypothetical protein HC793_00180 [Aquincola sp.]|nr:hypothetical protein [Aquincola sp.]
MKSTLQHLNSAQPQGPASKGYRALWIHCNYHPERQDRCIRLAEVFLAKAGLIESSKLVFVDNAAFPSSSATFPQGRWTRLQGSNTVREFSAWEEGWRHACVDSPKPDLVFLSNDTFPYHQPFSCFLAPLLRFKLLGLLDRGETDWALGLVERGFSYQHLNEFITSFFVVLGPDAIVPAMTGMTQLAAGSGLEADNSRGRVIWSVDPLYESLMNRWLLVPGGGGWYGASALTEKNFPGLRDKARCLLLEHALARRLVSNNVRLVSCFDLPPPLNTWVRRLYRIWEVADRRRRAWRSATP